MSFLSHNNRRMPNADRHDTVLRGRKLMKQAFVLVLALGGAWVVVESARALSVF